jgi:hypothetical protein
MHEMKIDTALKRKDLLGAALDDNIGTWKTWIIVTSNSQCLRSRQSLRTRGPETVAPAGARNPSDMGTYRPFLQSPIRATYSL